MTARAMASHERGQILVIMAVGLTVILLMAALVIDIGYAFLLRRQEQNAADPGALAAARYIKPTLSTGSMWNAACFYAVENGFSPSRTDTSSLCEGAASPGDGSTLTVNYPPSRAAGAFAGRSGYVEVVITRTHRTFLAGIIGLAQFPVSASAVAANDDGSAGSSSLVALSDKGCGANAAAKVNSGGIQIFPADGVTEPGGYIQINSDCGTSLAADDTCTKGSGGAFELNGNGEVIAPALYVRGGCVISGVSGTVTIPSGKTDEGAAYVGDPLALLHPPDLALHPIGICPGAPPSKQGTAANPQTCSIKTAGVVLDPGVFYGGWSISNNASIVLNPGIFIIAGGGITQTGGTLTSAAGRVFIYSTDAPTCSGSGVVDCQNDINLTGTGSLLLKGLSRTSPCAPYGATGCPYGGLLIWQDGNASGGAKGRADVELGGGAQFYISGTIYAPGGEVGLLGNGTADGCTTLTSGEPTNCAAVQIIADTFQVGGAAQLEMPYDPKLLYQLPLRGLVK